MITFKSENCPNISYISKQYKTLAIKHLTSLRNICKELMMYKKPKKNKKDISMSQQPKKKLHF